MHPRIEYTKVAPGAMKALRGPLSMVELSIAKPSAIISSTSRWWIEYHSYIPFRG